MKVNSSNIENNTNSKLSSKYILISLLGIYILMISWGLLSDSTWDDDCAMRYYNAKDALQNPRQFINIWNRPLFIILFALPVQLGKEMIIFQMAFISILTCYLLYKSAIINNISNAYLIIPFTAFQTYYFPISFNALSEPLSAFLLALGLYSYSKKNYFIFSISGSLLPLARLELSLLLLIWFIILIKEKQIKFIPVLFVPIAIWNFAGTYFDGDVFWLYNNTIGNSLEKNRYGNIGFWSYFHRYIFVIGPVIFYFLLIGIFESIYSKKFNLFIHIQFFLGFMIYVIFSWKLSLGQAAGFLRHLIVLSPLVSYIALNGYNYWIDSTNYKDRKNRILYYSIVVISLTYFFLSKKIISHHIISNNPEYYKLIIILTLFFIFIFLNYFSKSIQINKFTKLLIPLFVISITAGYTMITEPPNNHENQERQIMKKISEWYIDNNLDGKKTYANHIWFFYSTDLNRNSTNFERVKKENLNNAKPNSIVIWESHYSHRLFGDVTLEYFKNNSKFNEIARIISSDRRFGVIVYQTIK